MADAAVVDPGSGTPLNDDLERNWGEIAKLMRDMCAYYGYEGDVPPHVLVAVPTPEGVAESVHHRRLLQKLHIHLLAMWAEGKIPGPMTPDNITSLVKRAEQSAASLKKMKQDKSAEKQLLKAEHYRSLMGRATEIRKWW